MQAVRPRTRPAYYTQSGPQSRAELVRYFAWGYLSRRELNERLRQLAPQELHSAA